MAFSVTTSKRLTEAGIRPVDLMRAIKMVEFARREQDLKTLRNGVHSNVLIPGFEHLAELLTSKTSTRGGKKKFKVYPSLFQTRINHRHATYMPGDVKAAIVWLESQPIGGSFIYEEISEFSFISRYEKKETGWCLVYTKYKKLPPPEWVEYVHHIQGLMHRHAHDSLIFKAVKEHYTE